ncbi:hypothetical protein [Streptomyces sp. NPDC051211]|uniref:hypothetical protein n=1 Tax=Streptomyces sp. NPDC051211 TaxID=3154643 RepID=UPI00344FE2F6
MNRLALLVAGAAGLAVYAIAPAGAAVLPADTNETVTSCGYSGRQAGLATRVCAEITGTTVEFYGTVALAGPPSPGSPVPAARELFTTLSAEVVGGTTPDTQTKTVIFASSNLEVRGLVGTAPCGSTVRGTFGVSSFPWTANPVVHEVTVTC